MNNGIESAWLFVEVGDPCLRKKMPAMRAERRRRNGVAKRRLAVFRGNLRDEDKTILRKKVRHQIEREVRYELSA